MKIIYSLMSCAALIGLVGCGKGTPAGTKDVKINAELCESLAGFETDYGGLIYLSDMDSDAAVPACAARLESRPDDLMTSLFLIRALDAAHAEDDSQDYDRKIQEIWDSLGEDDSGAKDYVGAVLSLRGTLTDADNDAYFAQMQSAYDKGFIWAYDGMSQAYWHERGVEKDDYKSHQYLLDGMSSGKSHFEYSAAVNYDFGYGLAEDNETAIHYYTLAADKGHPSALNNLGAKYEIGEGVEPDLERAAQYFRRAHEAGSEWGSCNLGEAYSNGEGVDEDPKKAAQLFEQAANNGHALCKAWHAWALQTGTGTPQDYVMARHWARLAANENESQGHVILGQLYSGGHGVKKDMAKAFTAYEAGAQLGEEISQAELGEFFEKGLGGVEQNMDEALFWYKKAADQGNNWSQNRLGELYRFGADGVKPDLNLSLTYFFTAADDGYYNAKQNLKAFKRAHADDQTLSDDHAARLNADKPDWD